MPIKIGIVAGETSGDMAGAHLVMALQKLHPEIEFEGVAGPRMIEAGVVMGIDKELGRSGVRVGGACHSDSTADIFESVVGFVFYFLVSAFLFHARQKTAALHHKAGDDAVKDRAIVKAAVDVAQKVGNGAR